MVKRPKSPEVVEDCRFFTVYQPYPLNPDWHDKSDQVEAAKWVAECIGPNHLWAIHEKPRAHNMILLEISKEFVDHGLLLGEHRWSDFLKNPTKEEKERVTQVFHSFYSRGRDAQKDGWKVVAVDPRWLDEFVPGKGKIVHPYPETHWCANPIEDKTNKVLCRPLPNRSLPVEHLTPPVRPPAPVVGSTSWIAKQSNSTPSAKASAWASAGTNNQSVERARSTPSATPVLNSISRDADFPPVSNSGAAAPSNGKKARAKPVSLQKFVADAARSNNDSVKTGWAPVKPALPSGTKSPLVEEQPKGKVNAWGTPLKITPVERAKPSPTATPVSRTHSAWAPRPLDSSKEAWSAGERESSAHQTPSTAASGQNSTKNSRPASRSQVNRPNDAPKQDAPSPKPANGKLERGTKTEENKDNWAIEPKNKDRSKNKNSSENTSKSEPAVDATGSSGNDKENGNGKYEDIAAVDWTTKSFDWSDDTDNKFGKLEDSQWAPSSTPGAKSVDTTTPLSIESPALANEERGARSPPRQPKSWGTSRPPDSPYKGRQIERSSPRDRDNEFNSREGSRTRKTAFSNLPPGRSDGQWDHSGFSELKPKKRFDKPRGRYDKSRGEYDERPKGKNGSASGEFDKPRGRSDRSKDYTKAQDRPEESSSNGLDWAKLKCQVEDWAQTPESDVGKKGKGKEKPERDAEQTPKTVEEIDATIDAKDNNIETGRDEWGHLPEGNAGEAKSTGNAIVSASMDIDPAPELGPTRSASQNDNDEPVDYGEWGPPPPLPEKADEPSWGAWGPPPPSHLKKKMRNKVFRAGETTPKTTPKKVDKELDRELEAPEADFGEWGLAPSDSKKGPKGKPFKADKLKFGRKESTRDTSGKWVPPPSDKGWKGKQRDASQPTEDDASPPGIESSSASEKGSRDEATVATMEPQTDWGEWGPPPPSASKKHTTTPETADVDDYNEWGFAPHKAKKATYKNTKVKALDSSDANKKAEVNVISSEFKNSAGDWGESAPSAKPQQGNIEEWGSNPTANVSNGVDEVAFTIQGAGGAVSKHVFGSKPEDWGLPPAPLGFGDDDDGAQLHPWEQGTEASIWGDIADTQAEEYAPPPERKRKLKCPSHNFPCKPDMCKAMARWIKEVEEMESKGIDVPKDAPWKRDPNLPPTRHSGSRRGPRVRKKKEPSTIGRLRGFEDVDKEHTDGADYGPEEAINNSTVVASTDDEVWQAPVDGTAEQWGVQPSSDISAWS